MPNFQGSNLAWLAYYLGKVHRRVELLRPPLRLGRCRLSITSIPPVPLPVNVYASSEVYVAPARHSPRRTRFRPTVSTLIQNLQPQVVLVMCATVPSMARAFA